jgi:general secretion pathway protein B
MSYILEALKKSQRERALGEVPTIDSALPAGGMQRHTVAGGPWVAVAALVAGVALALAITWLWQWRATADETARPPAALAPPPDRVARAPEPQAIAVLPPTGDLPVRSAPAAVAKDRSSRTAAASVQPPAEPLRRAAEPRPTLLVEPDADAPFAPSLSELPADVRRAIGPMVLNVHVFSERTSERFVFINNRQYGEGDSLPDGLRLVRITPLGAVLSFEGVKFLISM